MKKTLAFTGAVYTDVGRVRSINQDNFSLSAQTLPDNMRTVSGYTTMMARRGDFVCGVFDGMGGELYGEEASKISAVGLGAHTDDIIFGAKDGINRYIQDVNAKICALISERGARMGTTVAAAIKSDMGLQFFNIGDSSIYMLRASELIKLSCDHLVVAQLVDCGIITAEQAKTDPRRHQLTQHIGIRPEEMIIEPYISETLVPEDGDIFLLCSDGVTDALTEADLTRILSANAGADVLSKNVVNCALDAGSRDNATAIVLKCLELDEEKPEPKNGVGKLILAMLGAMILGAVTSVLLHHI